jgi:hypothetical protein
MKRFLSFFAGLTLLTASSLAQATNPPRLDKADTLPRADLSTHRDALDKAKNFAKANNVVAAEQALAALNTAKLNTDDWHIETAQRLLQAADQLARDAQPATVATLANRALLNLTQADAKGRSVDARAAAKTLAGFIYERYLGDRTAAIAQYDAAAQLAPATAKNAKDAADRLRKTDNTVKQRVTRGGK